MCLWYVVAQACSDDREAQSVDITPEARERLDHFMNTRRLELGIPWREVATRAGVSYEALRALRTGPGGTADLTTRKIDAALEWTPGSVARIAAGGDPVELPALQDIGRLGAPSDAELDRIERQIGLDLSSLPADLRRALLRHYQALDARMSELERREAERQDRPAV
jgi:hypothetical protein